MINCLALEYLRPGRLASFGRKALGRVIRADSRREYRLTVREIHAHWFIVTAWLITTIRSHSCFRIALQRHNCLLKFLFLLIKGFFWFAFSCYHSLLRVDFLLQSGRRQIAPRHTPLAQSLFLDQNSLLVLNLTALHKQDLTPMLFFTLLLENLRS